MHHIRVKYIYIGPIYYNPNLFIYISFNDPFTSSDYIESNER